jgi:hypothetical protein
MVVSPGAAHGAREELFASARRTHFDQEIERAVIPALPGSGPPPLPAVSVIGHETRAYQLYPHFSRAKQSAIALNRH